MIAYRVSIIVLCYIDVEGCGAAAWWLCILCDDCIVPWSLLTSSEA